MRRPGTLWSGAPRVSSSEPGKLLEPGLLLNEGVREGGLLEVTQPRGCQLASASQRRGPTLRASGSVVLVRTENLHF